MCTCACMKYVLKCKSVPVSLLQQANCYVFAIIENAIFLSTFALESPVFVSLKSRGQRKARQPTEKFRGPAGRDNNFIEYG